MRRTKILLVTLAALAILFTGGCTNSSVSDDDLSSPSELTIHKTEETVQTQEFSDSITDEVCVSVDHVSDELLGKYDSYGEFVECEDKTINTIVLTTSIEVRDFRFLEVGIKPEEDQYIYIENKVLYSMDELLPEKPLVVAVGDPGICPGILPTRGIAFVDESNTIRYFAIMQSGKDGSLFLTEF